MKYEVPKIIILTDKELMGNMSTLSEGNQFGDPDGKLCTSCGFHVF